MATSREIDESHTDRHGRKKSLLLIVASNRRRGAEVFGERLTEGLDRRGWDVEFVALQSVDSDRTVNATPLANVEGLGRLNMSAVRALRQCIAAREPSVILANGGATLKYAALATTALRRRPIFAYTSIGEPRYWLRSPKHLRLQRFLHTRPDVVFAISQETRNQLIDELHVDPGRVHVAQTGVAPEYFLDSAPTHKELRLLFMGNLSPEKDPHKALDVVESIHGRIDVKLRIVGDGPLAPDLDRRSRDSALDGVVEFLGSVEDVTPHLQWADVLVLPSATEGLPGAALEAGAAGVPTVAFDVGGTSETMVPGTTGMLIASGDTDSMIEAVLSLASDRQNLQQMGSAAREFISQNFTLEESIQRYEELLTQELMESRAR